MLNKACRMIFLVNNIYNKTMNSTFNCFDKTKKRIKRIYNNSSNSREKSSKDNKIKSVSKINL